MGSVNLLKIFTKYDEIIRVEKCNFPSSVPAKLSSLKCFIYNHFRDDQAVIVPIFPSVFSNCSFVYDKESNSWTELKNIGNFPVHSRSKWEKIGNKILITAGFASTKVSLMDISNTSLYPREAQCPTELPISGKGLYNHAVTQISFDHVIVTGGVNSLEVYEGTLNEENNDITWKQ